MKARKIPYGVYDYEILRKENYLYVDKTNYIEELEDTARYILFTRPRRFGKSLLVSMLSTYYDVNKKDEFEELFGDTYVGKHPTKERNSYYILRFDFSGLNTESEKELEEDFFEAVHETLEDFLDYYEIEGITLKDVKNASTLFSGFLKKVKYKINGSIYVMIDEYDQFANELLGFNRNAFFNVVQKNGFVRKFFEVLKKGVADSTVGRIFITGVTPIAMDGMTSGFNIARLATNKLQFNEMVGFTEEEVISIAKEALGDDVFEKNRDNILDEMKFYYDGYLFNEKATKHIYNSDMCLDYIDNYIEFGESPRNKIDANAKSDYNKLENLITMGTEEENRLNIDFLEEVLKGEESYIVLADRFELGKKFDVSDFASLLFYMGLLTMTGDTFANTVSVKIPNETMKELYVKLFLNTMANKYSFNVDTKKISNMFRRMAVQGKNDLYVDYIEEVLHAMSNRDFQGMKELDVKMIAFTVSKMTNIYDVKSEREVEDGYIDLAYLPRIDVDADYYALIEFKYIKKAKASSDEIKEKVDEGEAQIEKYIKEPEIAKLNKEGKLKKWVLVFVKDKCVVNKEL